MKGFAMNLAHHRHDISDHVWGLLEPWLPGRKGSWGGVAHDNRRFINAVFWILRTGAPWRDLPPAYGDWKNTHRRFCRWRDKSLPLRRQGASGRGCWSNSWMSLTLNG
jgi:transposase